MSSHPNARLLERFHEAQGSFYAGGESGPLRELLSDDVAWHVPGESAIAGDYRGLQEVLDYFRRRRELASATLRIHVHDTMASDQGIVQLAGGSAERGGRERTWETVGIYRVAGGRIAEGWLIPFDQALFDEVWS